MKKQVKRDPLRSLELFVGKLAEANNIEPGKAVHIFKLIYDATPNGGLSDDDIESLTGYKQSEIRKVLRLLESYNLAVHRRRRHPEKEVSRYFWRIDGDTINIVLLNLKKKVLARLKERLQYEESKSFFICPEDGSRYTFEEAFNNNFTCPLCGALVEEDSGRGAERLRRKIDTLEEEIRRDEKKIYSS